jgi:hypothetical protein
VNFLEAVAALQAGECELVRVGNVFLGIAKGILTCFHYESDFPNKPSPSFSFTAEAYLRQDFSMVNPIPLTEKREVKRWAIISPSNTEYATEVNLGSAQRFIENHPTYSIVELTGTYDAPIPRKVKRRHQSVTTIQFNGHIGIPLELRGKTGILTFEWEENE